MKKHQPTHTSLSLSYGAWLVRCLTWLMIAGAFVLSMVTMSTCNFIQGAVFNYEYDDNSNENGDDPYDSEYPEYDYMYNNTPARSPPSVRFDSPDYFTLGITKANLVNAYGCLPYTSEIYEGVLDDGAAEGSAKAFGSIAAFLGGASTIAYFAFLMTGIKGRIFVITFASCLFTAAVSQSLTFVLFASNHCKNEYWTGYLSPNEQENYKASVTCTISQGGWFALSAFFLYMLAGFLVAMKWTKPAFTLMNVEWTKTQDRGTDSMVTTYYGDEENQRPKPAKEVGVSRADLQASRAAGENVPVGNGSEVIKEIVHPDGSKTVTVTKY